MKAYQLIKQRLKECRQQSCRPTAIRASEALLADLDGVRVEGMTVSALTPDEAAEGCDVVLDYWRLDGKPMDKDQAITAFNMANRAAR